MFGSQYKSQLALQFEAACTTNYDLNESDPKGYALYRRSYSRELNVTITCYTKRPEDAIGQRLSLVGT
jgi:hypothetical protein